MAQATYLGRETQVLVEGILPRLSGQDKAKLDKKIGGGAVGGPIMKDKLFFFGNYERLQESSESPVLRGVPSDSMRDGVLIYGCDNPGDCPATSVQGFAPSHAVPAGYHGMTPAELTAVDPLHLGPSQAVSDIFKQYPSPNDPGLDGYNIVGFRFASPIENRFNTYIGRIDYRHSRRPELLRTLQLPGRRRRGSVQQFPGQAAEQHAEGRRARVSRSATTGCSRRTRSTPSATATPTSSRTASGCRPRVVISFRFIDDFDALTATFGRKTPTHNFVDDFSWIKGSHTFKFGTNMRFTRVPRYDNTFSFNDGITNASWMAGVGRHYAPGNDVPWHGGRVRGAAGSR